MLGLTIRPLAEMDLKEAGDWYELQKPGLGHNFLEAAELLLISIRASPIHFQVKYSKIIRTAAVTGFPYSIHFIAENMRIVVLGVFHHKRNPKIWKRRKL